MERIKQLSLIGSKMSTFISALTAVATFITGWLVLLFAEQVIYTTTWRIFGLLTMFFLVFWIASAIQNSVQKRALIVPLGMKIGLNEKTGLLFLALAMLLFAGFSFGLKQHFEGGFAFLTAFFLIALLFTTKLKSLEEKTVLNYLIFAFFLALMMASLMAGLFFSSHPELYGVALSFYTLIFLLIYIGSFFIY